MSILFIWKKRRLRPLCPLALLTIIIVILFRNVRSPNSRQNQNRMLSSSNPRDTTFSLDCIYLNAVPPKIVHIINNVLKKTFRLHPLSVRSGNTASPKDYQKILGESHNYPENSISLSWFKDTLKQQRETMEGLQIALYGRTTSDTIRIISQTFSEFFTVENVYQFSKLSMKDSSDGFSELVQNGNHTQLLYFLCLRYGNHNDRLAERILNSSAVSCTPHPIKTIGIISDRLYHGGIEKVITLRIPMFLKMGYSIVLLNKIIDPSKEYPLDQSVKRVQIPHSNNPQRFIQLYQTIHGLNIDVLVHEQAASQNLLFDILAAKFQNVPVILIRHALTVESLRAKDSKVCTIHEVYKTVDTLVVVSRMEESYYKAMGVNARYLPNPQAFGSISEVSYDGSGPILWVGRLHPFKNYLAPVRIMEIVVRSVPKALLIMLGPEEVQGAAKSLLDTITKAHLDDNIRWMGNVLNTSAWYSKAKVYLMTSDFESFSMSILEAKAYAVPLVTYSLPYLEILKDGKGYIAVPQDDIETAASAIVYLYRNRTECNRLSREARESYQDFLSFNQEQAWKEIINNVFDFHSINRSPSAISTADFRLFMETVYTQFQKAVFGRIP